MEKYKYQGVEYYCNSESLATYLRKRDDFVAFVQRGIESDYARIYKDDKRVVVNSEIDRDNYGQKAEATRIKLCAALNTLVQFFADNGFEIESESLGVITCADSALDERAGKQSDKVNAADLL